MIESFLNEALASREKVSLPDFGTFSTVASNAQLDEQEGIYTPPHRKIEFVADTPYTDEYSVVNYIVENSAYTREEAEEAALELSRKLKSQIDTSNYAEIEGFGYFKKNGPVEVVSFYPFEESTELPESFGLPKLKVNPIVPAADTAKGKTKKNEEKMLWWVLVPIIVLTVGVIYIFVSPTAKDALFAYNPFDGEKIDSVAKDTTLKAVNPLALPKDSLDNKPDTVIKPVEKKPVVKEEEPQEGDELIVQERTMNYYLVVASYSSKENAFKAARKAIEQGYIGTRIVEASGERYRLTIGNYPTKPEADRKADEARKYYRSIWIFKY
ncbi:SPOR domain-containing protein [Flammeovirgaceae bacterium SG7u.111]|nr:SPOR domain-containing protein [Flammeovirgaceae bacterium SG7u.132]WPO33191.1 SPOR domain-containing protein [Flammeovirgaceae bacterium SG7u.111]